MPSKTVLFVYDFVQFYNLLWKECVIIFILWGGYPFVSKAMIFRFIQDSFILIDKGWKGWGWDWNSDLFIFKTELFKDDPQWESVVPNPKMFILWEPGDFSKFALCLVQCTISCVHHFFPFKCLSLCYFLCLLIPCSFWPFLLKKTKHDKTCYCLYLKIKYSLRKCIRVLNWQVDLWYLIIWANLTGSWDAQTFGQTLWTIWESVSGRDMNLNLLIE